MKELLKVSEKLKSSVRLSVTLEVSEVVVLRRVGKGQEVVSSKNLKIKIDFKALFATSLH